MFKGSKLKKVLVLSIMLVIAFSTITIAANEIYQKQITATFGKVKIKVGGIDVTKNIETTYGAPAFIANDRTYVPLRALELAGLQVGWDSTTNTVEIYDIKSALYEAEIKKKDNEIAELKKQIEELKKNASETKDLDDLEDEFNDLFGTYEGVNFEIQLKQKSSSRIDVNIYVNLSKSSQKTSWNNMKESHIRDMIKYITEAITTDIGKIDIYGSIYDEYSRKNLVTFNKKKNSNLSISYDGKGSIDYEEELYNFAYDEFYYEAKIKISDFDVYTSGNKIYFEVYFSSRYIDEWEYLRISDIEYILDNIADEIIDYYGYNYRYVYGYIYIGDYEEGQYYRDVNKNYGEFEFSYWLIWYKLSIKFS